MVSISRWVSIVVGGRAPQFPDMGLPSPSSWGMDHPGGSPFVPVGPTASGEGFFCAQIVLCLPNAALATYLTKIATCRQAFLHGDWYFNTRGEAATPRPMSSPTDSFEMGSGSAPHSSGAESTVGGAATKNAPDSRRAAAPLDDSSSDVLRSIVGALRARLPSPSREVDDPGEEDGT